MLSKTSKIFVTGSTGFLGNYIVRKLLSDGYSDIICLKRESSETALINDIAGKVQWVTGDILDIPLMDRVLSGVDCIIHAAAIVSHTASKKKMLQTAMDGTANLVNMALSAGVKKFIHISSVSAIGRAKPVEHINEKQIFSHSKYDTTYGLAKFLAEQEVWRGHAEGLNVTILNPSMILGPGDWNKSSTQIFKRLYRGMKFYPEGITGWVDVRDVAEVTLKCLVEDFNGERFIISAENQKYKNVFERISAQLGVKAPSKLLTQNFAGILWRFEAIKSFFTGHKPAITKETVCSTSVLSTYDNSKSIKHLNIQYTPLEKTIAESCRLFLETYPNGKNYAIF
jgi:dihydroflavonol-4-reductase